MITIYYGILNNNIDVTDIVFEKCIRNNIIFIPGHCDDRDSLFGDPLPRVNKYVFFNIRDDCNSEHIEFYSFYRDVTVFYDILNKKIYSDNIPVDIANKFMYSKKFNFDNVPFHIANTFIYNKNHILKTDEENLELERRNKASNNLLQMHFEPKIIDKDIKLGICAKLQNIHNNLKLDFGMFYENMSMQLLILKYINGSEKILEIGGNIGRCSLLIAYILNAKSNNNFVSMESNPDYTKQLIHNRDQNGLFFHIENSTLSSKKIIQLEDKTSISDVLVDGFFKVKIISWDNLIKKYKINFDMLIIDCNDAFYDILLDFPEMLNKMKLVIMKNEYYDVFKKIKIENILIDKNFELEYSETGGNCPCYYSYYEVWKPKYN
jgi:FkbM family methyltransferase